ncbi:type VII secretion integral membrane protein EccD [Corynebacterium lowii]|uniref:EccD-like transmembrane domain-containing protein n=1 Tax=Corynebacterium lowii TaxID=1544413 RepID=A0A0Q0ULX8_9CORY|nr:type VII secretion integral membrane protein EccD [Corynebacterium lowii]KQB87419.1 hypothetical protein Clow_00478 [Corynebacterium lowii]MDP9851991.1 type VII secretion integral membrane protein EccD [Corynebacterium lowii]
MTTSHMLRLRILMHAGSYHRQADLAVPAQSSLAECLDELLAILDAPLLPRPWQARTAAGTLIDATASLSQAGLRDGDSLFLSPQQEIPHPVIRDATEALAEDSAVPTQSVTPLHCAHAAATMALCALMPVLNTWLNPWLSCLLCCLIALLLTLWAKPLPGLIIGGIGHASAAGFLWVRHTATPGWLAYALLAALLCATLALCLFGLAARNISLRIIAAASMIFILSGSALLLWWSTHRLSAVAAGMILFSLLAIFLSPRLSTSLAGLHPPRLPSSGQNLDISDSPAIPVEEQARRAHLLYEGLYIGITFVFLPALILLGFSTSHSPAQAGFSAALLLGAALATVLHALRHRNPLILWAHLIISLGALVALSFLAGIHLVFALLALVLLLICLTMPWWLPRLPAPEPTHMLWWERCESLAIAAIIPLCAHHMGLFSAIRGLGL